MEEPLSPRAVADALPDGLVIAGPDQCVVLVNDVAGQMLGAAPDQLVGRPLLDVLTLQDQDSNDWYATNRPYAGLITRTGVPEQSWFLPGGVELLVAARIIRPDRDRPVQSVAVSLRTARGRARLDRERSDLVATVAHELRSPLTGVKGFVATLLSKWDRLTDDQKLLMLATVNADADRLSRLIAELLDVARIDTGRLSLYPRPTDVEAVVTRVVRSVQVGTHRPILAHFDDDLPEITVDQDKFVQVTTNLIENGVLHGDGTVLISARALGEQADFPGVEMTVDDEGEGISPEIRARVFTKFWKHGVRGGSGLGMYIVNGLVRAHGGSVTIGDSAAGGARITIAWPADDRRPD